mmetsp:Transcript_6025/g.8356  ORF Transcript_6025/g.8356 Transcript_6025/m.8356 type:complete len:258 (+) Transcript_6025:51-824(+)
MGKYGNVWNYEINLNNLSTDAAEKDIQRATAKQHVEQPLPPEEDQKPRLGVQYSQNGAARIDRSKVNTKRTRQPRTRREREKEDRIRRMAGVRLRVEKKMGDVSVENQAKIRALEEENTRREKMKREREKMIQGYLEALSSRKEHISEHLKRSSSDRNASTADTISSNEDNKKSAAPSILFRGKHTRMEKQQESGSRGGKRVRITSKKKGCYKVNASEGPEVEMNSNRALRKSKKRKRRDVHLLSFSAEDPEERTGD